MPTTKRDIFHRILSEVSGKSEDEVAEMFRQFETFRPGELSGMDVEMSDDEAEKLMTELRAEKEGIAHWLMEGAMRARKKMQ